MKPQVRYERRQLAELMPHPENPREISRNSKRALGASLRKFGMVEPIVFNETSGKVVSGHQRMALLIEQGETEAMVSIGSWSEADERALIVELNNREAQGKFTDDVRDFLSPALTGLSLSDFKELRLDAVGRDPKSDDAMSAVETGPVFDEFWISARGPLVGQAEALEALKAALGKIPGVTVEIGAIKR